MDIEQNRNGELVEETEHPLSHFGTIREKRIFLYALSLFLDMLSLIAGYMCALRLRDEEWMSAGGHSIILIALPVFLMLEIAREVQSAEALESRFVAISRSFGALGATAIIIIGLDFLFNSDTISRVGLFITFGAGGFFVLISKLIVDLIFRQLTGGTVLATILILDGMSVCQERHARVVDVGAMGLWPDLDRPDMIDTLSRIIAPFDRVIVACTVERRQAWSVFLRGHDVGGEILLDRQLLGAVAIGEYDGRDTLILSRGPLNLMNRLQKRTLDIVVASIALVILAPLLLLVALLIRLDSPGPVLFRQWRVGQGNRQFRIFKFRSMHVLSTDSAGARSATRGDERITRVGRFIRRSSIDELPQLLNVLRGEMSMVGPRPHALGSLAGNSLFWQVSRKYWLRHTLKPGITGLAQIRGYRGATDHIEDLERRVQCDLEYLANWSLWGDIIILIKTVRVIIHKNAY